MNQLLHMVTFKGFGKKIIVAYFKVLSQHFPEGAEKTMNIISILSLPAKI
jgi:hypothetical protein